MADDTLWEHFNDNSDDSAGNVYAQECWAQTFTPSETHNLSKVAFKCCHFGVTPKTGGVAIRAVDGAGLPTGDDLAEATFDTHIFPASPAYGWAEITLYGIELAAGTQYALLIRNPDAEVGDRLVLRMTTAGGYPGGKLKRSTNYGVTWGHWWERDAQFETWWAEAPPPPPPPTRQCWAVTDIQAECLATGYRFVATTSKDCHLWLRLTFEPIRKHPRTHIRRGLSVVDDVYLCFTQYRDYEQEEAGDTYTHTFTMLGIPLKSDFHFYLWGTIAENPSPSQSPIFTYHWPPLPYRNQTIGAPTAVVRAYSDYGRFVIFWPPEDYICGRLAAVWSKQDAAHTGTYPPYYYLTLRTAPNLTPCGQMLAVATFWEYEVPEYPTLKWLSHGINSVTLLKNHPYALVATAAAPFGGTNWGVVGVHAKTACIMSHERGRNFTPDDPCPVADETVGINFVSCPFSYKTPEGEFTLA